MSIRVLVLSQYYDPEPISKPSTVAAAMVARGHEVAVLTGLPNYPTGRIHPSYRLRPLQREWLAGIPVTRVFEIPYHGASAPRRFVNYGSFMVAAALAGSLMRRRDVAYVWHPPLTVGAAAWLISALRHTPFVLDVQDIWPDSAITAGMLQDGWVVAALRKLELFVYGRASHIVVLSDEARDNLIGKGVSASKITVLPHAVEIQPLKPLTNDQTMAARADLQVQSEFTVTFAGNLGMVQGLDTVIEAARLLVRQPLIAFRFVGDGTEAARLRHKVERLQLHNVRFLGWRPAHEMPQLLAASDALLAHLLPGSATDTVVPAKVVSYLAAGRPLIVAMQGPAARIVSESAAGIAVRPNDPEAIADAVMLLSSQPSGVRDAMGARGHEYAKLNHASDRIMAELERILIATSRRPACAAS